MSSRAATAVDWRVRRARLQDVGGVAVAVEELLLELGGKPAPHAALRDAARALIEDEEAGVLIVAQAGEGDIVGLLGVSWQTAVRIPGRYGLIQELWVHPGWRSLQIGAEMLRALVELASERDLGRIEVGLPGERYPELAATESFYERNGFQPIGTRMRLLLR
jgi:branched-chain amino acid aminotransferase